MNAYFSLTVAPSRSALLLFLGKRSQFPVPEYGVRVPATGRGPDNSSGGSSAACAARYFFTQPPTVVSFSPYSRATSAIDRFDSTMSFATSSRNSGLYFVYFPVNSSHPFRIGPYLVRSPESGRHAQCGTEPRAGARFCDGCGAPVTAHETHAEFKQLMVLFADVVHSMDIAAALGAERLREIMADLSDRCAAVVQRYGSTVTHGPATGLWPCSARQSR